ncbi:MAG: DUF4465 domain-containing protein [Crocinitomicaceae bacterium]|nr:DUF4465 domain-containing protein [Crocinitomicaceae bacterium]
MKKIYTIVTALLVGVSTQAQLEDFENFTLTPESFDNGSAGNGDFVFNGMTLNNSYDSGSSSWSGFAISNTTDVTTAGWTNQYSAYPGFGADSSSNYAMGYWSPAIVSDGGIVFNSIQITNSTYGYLSMRDGDGYGKQFGSALDGSGVDDGTNGEDFFKVWIICEGFGQKDSIEFYLADYRFADSAQDYIIDSWETIDFSGLSFGVKDISFRFESSDNDPTWGIKTPAYVAVDNIYYDQLEGIDELDASAFSAYPNPMQNQLNIVGESAQLHLSDMKGRTVVDTEHAGVSNIDTSSLPSGIYFLTMVTENGQVTYKVVK